MPLITPIPFDWKSIALSPEKHAVRSPGVHLTDITKDMLRCAGISRGGKGKPFSPEDQHMLFESGFLWERMIAFILTVAHEEANGSNELLLLRPGEQMMDGVALTPDAINIPTWCIEEWKATAMRSKGFDIQSKRPEWLWQAGAYCRVFGMRKAIFRIWHHGELPHTVTQLLVEWTQQEIEDNWFKILDHWKYMKERP
jgi:hypothetical protein